MSCLLFAQGRIGKIEEKKTLKGTPYVVFSVASSNGEKDNDKGEYKTEWTDFTAWGKKSEYILNYAKVGSIVSVIAIKSSTKYEDKDSGKKHIYVDYRVSSSFNGFQILSGFRTKEDIKDKESEQSVPVFGENSQKGFIPENNLKDSIPN